MASETFVVVLTAASMAWILLVSAGREFFSEVSA